MSALLTNQKKVALNPEVEYHFEMGRKLAERIHYPSNILNKIPSQAIDSFSRVGYYFDLIQLQKGEVAVDLGSSSGMDAFFYSNRSWKYWRSNWN